MLDRRGDVPHEESPTAERSATAAAARHQRPQIYMADVSAPAAEPPADVGDADDMVVTAWEVSGKIDYNKLIEQFGSQAITPALIEKFERVTGCKAHPWIRRGIFFSHRDLDMILDNYAAASRCICTRAAARRRALHLGHLIPFLFTKYLQDVFKCVLVIQMTDDEKFLWKDLQLDECHRLGFENAKDIIACGFDISKTLIFSDLDYVGHMYPVIVKIWKAVTYNQVKGIFGFEDKGVPASPATSRSTLASTPSPPSRRRRASRRPSRTSSASATRRCRASYRARSTRTRTFA